MLARRLPGLLPPPTLPELLEITRIHSIAGLLNGGGRATGRPFRAPHHSASQAALIGGRSLRPGEVTLAHQRVQ
jgi:magnesium chelatase family protein